MGIKTDKNKTHMLRRLYNFLYNKDYEIVAKEDGFYIGEWDEEGDICFRRHSDCNTHWHSLPNLEMINQYRKYIWKRILLRV